MALKEQDIVFTTKDLEGNTIIQMPITRAGNIEDVMSIKQGGTGATSAEEARKNLGITDILLDYCYPVGSLYWSKNATNPGTLFGGTWSRVKDKFVLAAGDSYAQGATGGAATVALTTAQMPAHSHTRGNMNITGTIGVVGEPGYFTGAFYKSETKGSISNSGAGDFIGGFDASLSWTGATSVEGSGAAHENMPPYVAYYCWERTA